MENFLSRSISIYRWGAFQVDRKFDGKKYEARDIQSFRTVAGYRRYGGRYPAGPYQSTFTPAARTISDHFLDSEAM
jgi:hypothetical protein